MGKTSSSVSSSGIVCGRGTTWKNDKSCYKMSSDVTNHIADVESATSEFDFLFVGYDYHTSLVT